MESSEQELAQHFAAMEDDALLDAAASREDLTDVARDVLESEMRSRRLQLPAPGVLPLPVTPDVKIVTVRRFAAYPDGMLARSALESAGIPCFLRDENTVRTVWHLSGFLGGVRLDVAEDDCEAAEHVLLLLDENEPEVLANEELEAIVSQEYLCPECQSIEINRVPPESGLLSLFSRKPVSTDQRWKCNDCGTEWIDNDRE